MLKLVLLKMARCSIIQNKFAKYYRAPEIKQIMFTVMKRNHYIKTLKYHDSLRKKI